MGQKLFLLFCVTTLWTGICGACTEEKGTSVNHGLEYGSDNSFDSQQSTFTGSDQIEMITSIKMKYFTHSGKEYLNCVGFKYGEVETPCYGDPQGTDKELNLGRNEYVKSIVIYKTTEFINTLEFTTNLGNKISAGPKNGLQTTEQNGGAPMLYVTGTYGMWMYKLKFTFFCHELDAGTDLRTYANTIALAVFNLVKGQEFDAMLQYRTAHDWMLTEVMDKGCRNNVETACNVKFILDQLITLNINTKSLTDFKPRLLSMYKDHDTNQLLEYAKDAQNFQNIISTITFGLNDVETTLTTHASSLGEYFKKTSGFDKDIAIKDRAYIKDTLKTLKDKANTAMNTIVKVRLDRLLKVALGSGVGDLATKIGYLVTDIALTANPVKGISDPDPVGIAERADAVAKAASNVGKAASLVANLNSYVQHLVDVQKLFQKNKNSEPMKAMNAVLKALEDNSGDQDALVEKFIDQYGAYSPAVSREKLTYGAELLMTVASRGCDLMESAETIAGITVTIISEAKQDCVYIYAEITKLATIYEDIYTFQFEIIDKLALIVKGNIATKMADKISTISGKIDTTAVTIGSLMVEMQMQAGAHAHCNVLEYTKGGKRPRICEKLFYSSGDIINILAYTGASIPTNDAIRIAYIPTERPAVGSNEPWVDLDSFMKGNPASVSFTGNNIQAWLLKYGFLLQTDLNRDIEATNYIKSFEVYIPGIKCKGGQTIDYIEVDAESSEFTKLFIKAQPITYIRSSTLFRFKYHERSSCVGDVETFDKKDTINGNTAALRLCVLSPGRTSRLVYPSLLSTWNLKMVRSPSSCELEKVDPASNPLITVKMNIRQVLATGINMCWPLSRCQSGQKCQQGLLSFSCVNNKRKRLLELIYKKLTKELDEMDI